MQHLIVFSVGPVQDFINTARRSRDLWYGSWMLSQLARVVAEEIVKANGELIFPTNTEIESVPNKIVGVVETDNLKKFADDIKETTVTYLVDKLAKTTLDGIKSKTFNRALADAQIKDLLELYWVGVPYNDRKYAEVREQAEAMLIARKNTRDFNQMTGANAPKSSLDGSRESVIDEEEYPKNNANDKEDKIRDLYEKYRARQGERLSGVDLLKRLGARKDEPDFKSASHMAAIPFMRKLGAAKDKLISNIRDSFGIATWEVGDKDEGSLLFENRLIDLMPNQKKQKELLNLFNQKIKAVAGDSRPSPYYALIRADGDNMGKVIDGQEDKNKHQQLSKALSKFAGEVEDIVNEQHQGLLIYSGGDDVLAYLPVDKALSCADALVKKFKNELGEFFAKDGTTSPTLSIGIVIAHHLDPLSDVLKLAKNAERTAKDVTGKNGLAVTLSKRSGVDRTIVGKFSDLYTRLNEMIVLTNHKIISGGTAYELQELQRVLPDDFSLTGLQDEAIRIVKRKQSAEGKQLSEEDKARYIKIVDGWLKNITSIEQKPKHYSLHDLANEMIIAKSLADGAEPTANQAEEAKNES